jgi:hypothetical protein
MLPVIDRIGRRQLLLVGSVCAMAIHIIIASVMATKGHAVSSVNGNANLTWVIKGDAGKAVIAFSYIFTAVYGFTWVCQAQCLFPSKTNMIQSIGTSSLDLRVRSIPPQIPCKGSRPVGLRKLDL